MKTGLMMKRARRMPAGAIGAVIAGVLSGCFDAPPQPVAPRWDVGLTAPISAKSYTLEDLVRKDTSILQVGAGNLIVYRVNARSTTSTFGDIFAIAPQSTTTRAR